MKCAVCGAKWNTGNNNPIIYSCPICDMDFNSDESKRIFENVNELLIYLLSSKGKDVFLDKRRINNYMNDLFPQQTIETSVYKKLFNEGFGNKLFDSLSSNSENINVDEYIKGYDDDCKAVASDVIQYLCRTEEIVDNTNSVEFFTGQYKFLNDINYQINALEKALSYYGDDDDTICALSDLKLRSNDIEGYKALIEKSASLGNDLSQYKMYEILKNENDTERAHYYLKESADRNNTIACFKMYNLMCKEPDNVNMAIDFLIKSATNDYLPAMYDYAIRLLYGENVKEDASKAIALLKKCSDMGDIASKKKLWWIYSTGYKIKKDPLIAQKYKT